MSKTFKGDNKESLKDKYLREREARQNKRQIKEEKKSDRKSDSDER